MIGGLLMHVIVSSAILAAAMIAATWIRPLTARTRHAILIAGMAAVALPAPLLARLLERNAITPLPILATPIAAPAFIGGATSGARPIPWLAIVWLADRRDPVAPLVDPHAAPRAHRDPRGRAPTAACERRARRRPTPPRSAPKHRPHRIPHLRGPGRRPRASPDDHPPRGRLFVARRSRVNGLTYRLEGNKMHVFKP